MWISSEEVMDSGFKGKQRVWQVATARDGGLEHYPEAGSAANIGIMLFRPSAADFAKVSSETMRLFHRV